MQAAPMIPISIGSILSPTGQSLESEFSMALGDIIGGKLTRWTAHRCLSQISARWRPRYDNVLFQLCKFAQMAA
jgi:hypothetical protein